MNRVSIANHEKELLRKVLTDNLDQALNLSHPESEISNLIRRTKHLPKPLSAWSASLPRFITTSVAYTCGVGCEMCNAGFADKKFLFDQYEYLSKEEFDDLAPWIKKATHVALVGLGETLDSPHIEYFLEKLQDKVSFVSTSGVPINRKIIEKLIHSRLHYLNLSFDGKTTAGHGSGRDSYVKKFWEKVKLIQKIKQSLKVRHPSLHLTVAVDTENIDQLYDLFQTCLNHGILSADLIYMVPSNQNLFEKSVFSKFKPSVEKINNVMKIWNKKGMQIRFFEEEQLSSHFSKSKEELPQLCKTCWVINPEQFTRGWESRSDKYSEFTCLQNYQKGSKLKKDKNYVEAESFFQYVVHSTTDSALKGKAWFHLGELKLKARDDQEAFNCMEKAVRFCFDHSLAFAYLALLHRLIKNETSGHAERVCSHNFLDLFKPVI